MDSINWTDKDIGDVLESESEDDVVGSQEDIDDVANDDDGMSGVESDENIDVGLSNSDEFEDTRVLSMARDIKGRLFSHNRDKVIDIHEGQTFRSVDEFRNVLKDYAIQECFYMDKKKNEKDR